MKTEIVLFEFYLRLINLTLYVKNLFPNGRMVVGCLTEAQMLQK